MALRPPHTAEQIDLPSPPPPSSSSSLSSDSQRFIPTPFLIKTYQLVDDVSIDSIVSWSDDGKAFVVWNPAEFARDVLPKHFKHNNFSSFVRQLNTYGFRKIMPDRWEFSHDCFRKGNKQLLCDIMRRKPASGSTSAAGAGIPGATALSLSVATIPAALMDPPTSNSSEGLMNSWNSTPASAAAPFTPSPSSAAAPFTPSDTMTAMLFVDNSIENSSSSSRAHLIDENDLLKKKNTQLCKELSHMKSMCTNIFSMMSNYNPGSGLVLGLGNGPGPPPMLAGCGSHNSSQAESMMIPLHLMPIPELPAAVVEIETRAVKSEAVPERLSLNPSFSRFQYGSKRARVEDGSIGEPVEQDELLQLQQPGSSLSR